MLADDGLRIEEITATKVQKEVGGSTLLVLAKSF